MRVLHYVTKMDRAGQETFIMNVFREIDRKKIQFDFLCTENSKGDYDNEINQLGGKIYYINLNQKNGKLRHIDNYIIQVKSLKSYVKTHEIFHIHTHHAFDAYISAKAAVKVGFKKVIVHSHSDYAEYHIILNRIFRHMLSKLPIIECACSKAAGEWLFSNKKYLIIKNGIKTEDFKYNKKIRSDYRKLLGIENKYVIGHVGRFEQMKNHELIVKAFAEFVNFNPDSSLVFVGDGSLINQIKQKVEEFGIKDKVLFLGVRNDVNNIYQAMDLFIFPSIFEGLGIVAIEAQCAGLVCLLSDNIPNEIEVSNNIIRCSLNEPLSRWCEKIQQCFNTIKLKERVSGRKKVVEAGYDIIDTCEKISDIYLRWE